MTPLMITGPIVALALLLSSAARAATEARLDAFLGGVAQQCHVPDMLEAYWRSLEARYGLRADASAMLKAPPEIASLLGAPRAEDKGNHVFVTVPTSGSLRGLKVAELQFAIGKSAQVEITALNIVFAAPFATVKRTIGKDVSRAQAAITRSRDPHRPEMNFNNVEGRPILQCEYSF